MSSTKIIIADDHGFIREGLKRFIEKEPSFSIVAEASDGKELLNKLKSHACDIIILDLSMPEMDGIEAIKQIRKEYPRVKILVLSMLKDYEHFEHAISGGADGFMAKDDACIQINFAIKKVLEGKKFVSSLVSTMLTDRYVRSLEEVSLPSLDILTKREKQVLELIACGMANKNIADKLKISIRTVANHRANLCEKLGFRTTAALVKYAITKGLV